MRRSRLRFVILGAAAFVAGLGCASASGPGTAVPHDKWPGSKSERIARLVEESAALEAQVDEFERRIAALGPGATDTPHEMDGTFSIEFYEIVPLQVPEIAEKRRFDVMATLYGALKTAGIRTVAYASAGKVESFHTPWPDDAFEAIPTPVLLVAASGLAPERRGLEWDLVVPTKSGSGWHVTLLHGLDASFAIAFAESAGLPPVAADALSSESLRTRYGIGPVENGGREWKRAELATLDSALARLSSEERARIRDLPFRRVREVSERPPGLPAELKAAGLYRSSEAGDHWIEIADSAFERDGMLFVGEPERPSPPSERSLLHEIGHAIALRDRYEAGRLAIRIRDEQMPLIRELNRFSGKRIGPEQAAALQRVNAQLSGVTGVMTPLLAGLGDSTRSPVLAAYAELPQIHEKPTRYGRTAIGESFAESFSLYRLDPQALARVSPEAVAFFEEGRHLPRD